MKKLILFLLVILFEINLAHSQEKPIYNHFLINPYAYNPAFAGYDYRPVLFLSYRQQWMGIEGAPVTSAAFFHAPLNDQFSFGTSIYNDKRSILNTSNILLTLSYKVRFDIDHYVSFGLSGGLGFNSINGLDEIMLDPRYANDPALFNAMDNNLFLDGQFGLNYHNKGLNLGIALPRLFENGIINEQEFSQGNLDPLNAYQFMLNYKSYNKESITFEPTIIYRIQQDNLHKYFEAGGLVNIRNMLYFGGSYRQNYGISTLLGINIKDAFSVGYSYDIATEPISGYTNGTHEVSIRINFGEEKRPKKRQRSLVKNTESDAYQEYLNRQQEEDPEPKSHPKKYNPADELGEQGEITNYSGPKEVTKGNHLLELEKGYYVVVGVFNAFEKAENYSDWVFEQGYYTRYGYNSGSGYYYVYAYYNLSDNEKALQEKERISSKSFFNNVWVLSVQ